jgi:hypothetical protein
MATSVIGRSDGTRPRSPSHEEVIRAITSAYASDDAIIRAPNVGRIGETGSATRRVQTCAMRTTRPSVRKTLARTRTNRVGPVLGGVRVVCPRRKARRESRRLFWATTKNNVPGGTSTKEYRRQSGVMTRTRTGDSDRPSTHLKERENVAREFRVALSVAHVGAQEFRWLRLKAGSHEPRISRREVQTPAGRLRKNKPATPRAHDRAERYRWCRGARVWLKAGIGGDHSHKPGSGSDDGPGERRGTRERRERREKEAMDPGRASPPLLLSPSPAFSASSSPTRQVLEVYSSPRPTLSSPSSSGSPCALVLLRPPSRVARGHRPGTGGIAGPSRRLPVCAHASESGRPALLTLALWMERARARRRA